MTPDALVHHAATDCANCGAAASGNFCHQCGQETILHPPSAREFVHEFIGHYVALEGKLWKSLGLLLFRPGRLTLEYINGRRVCYVQPLRLYLTLSLVFFAVLKFTTHIGTHEAERQADVPAARHAAAQAKVENPAPEQTGDMPSAVLREDSPEEFFEGTAWIRNRMRGISPHLGDKADAFTRLKESQREAEMAAAFYNYVPYAVFFMMPVFALYLKVLYLGSGRRYGEHLLFALHVNGLALLLMTLMLFVPSFLGVVKFGLFAWLALYLPLAMRRVYGGSLVKTALRWFLLSLLHLVTIFAAILLGVGFGTLH